MDDKNDDIYIIHNDGINRLIDNTYQALSMDDNFDGYVEGVPLIEKKKNSYMETQRQVFSPQFYCWWAWKCWMVYLTLASHIY